MKIAVLNSGAKYPVVGYNEARGTVCLAMKKKPGSHKVKGVWMDLKFIKGLEDKKEEGAE